MHWAGPLPWEPAVARGPVTPKLRNILGFAGNPGGGGGDFKNCVIYIFIPSILSVPDRR